MKLNDSIVWLVIRSFGLAFFWLALYHFLQMIMHFFLVIGCDLKTSRRFVDATLDASWVFSTVFYFLSGIYLLRRGGTVFELLTHRSDAKRAGEFIKPPEPWSAQEEAAQYDKGKGR